jgi:hypothetical protein
MSCLISETEGIGPIVQFVKTNIELDYISTLSSYQAVNTHIFVYESQLLVERMDPTRLPKIMINWKPEVRKKRGRPRRTWKDGIYTAISEIGLRMGEWNNRRQWHVEVGRRRQAF